MVGAAGPLRNGDEVDFLLPPPAPGGTPKKTSTGNPRSGGRAVGAVRVQVGAAKALFILRVPCLFYFIFNAFAGL